MVGEYKKAGRHYRDAKRYQDALRCFHKIGDETNLARVYEWMGDLRRAEETWEKLGKEKDVQRVKRKRREEQQKSLQMDLFSDRSG